MEYTYNLSGGLIETKYPSGRVVKNVLDENGKLSIVQSKKNENYGYWDYAKNFQFTAAGAVSDMQFGNGKWESTDFNSRLQPTQIALGSTKGAVDKLDLTYEYHTGTNPDNNGNILKQTINVLDPPGQNDGFTAVQTYTYDELNRLKSAVETGTDGWNQTFVYDRYGNKNFDETNTTTLTKNCGGSPLVMCDNDREVENPEIDPANNRIKELQPDGDSNKDYEYDDAGNTIKDPDGREFIYDGENKQIEVKNSSGNPIGQYFFDGDGKRVKKVVPTTGETTIFHYDAGGKLIAEYSTIVETTDPQVSYLTNDHLGSPRITTDKDGDVHSRRDFMPFGEELTAVDTTQRASSVGYVGDSVRQKFTGYERDEELDLDFAKVRMHSFIVGRFRSPDPLMASQNILVPQTANRYVYTNNSPLRYIDPTGMIPVDLLIVENGPTTDGSPKDVKKGKAEGNPFGHTAIAITGKGLFSMGNGDKEPQVDGKNNILGGGVLDYLKREVSKRDTTITIIATTPDQDNKAEESLLASATNGEKITTENITKDNCSTRSNKALDAAGIGGGGYRVENNDLTKDSPLFPGTSGMRAKENGTNPTTFIIKKGAEIPEEVLEAIKQFEVPALDGADQ